MLQKWPPQRQSKPVNPTLFLQLSQRFFFGLSLLANEQSSKDMPAIAPAMLSDVSSLAVTVVLEVTAAGSVVTDAQAVLSESTDEALPLATADDAVSLDTTDVSDDALANKGEPVVEVDDAEVFSVAAM